MGMGTGGAVELLLAVLRRGAGEGPAQGGRDVVDERVGEVHEHDADEGAGEHLLALDRGGFLGRLGHELGHRGDDLVQLGLGGPVGVREREPQLDGEAVEGDAGRAGGGDLRGLRGGLGQLVQAREDVHGGHERPEAVQLVHVELGQRPGTLGGVLGHGEVQHGTAGGAGLNGTTEHG